MSAKAGERGSTSLRRALFGAALGLGTWIFIESAAFIGYWVVDEEPFSFARARGEMRSRGQAEAPDRTWSPAEPQVLHPYLGYVYDATHSRPSSDSSGSADSADSANASPQKSRWGFADSSPPLHRRGSDRLVIGILGGSFARQFADVAAELLSEPLQAAGVLDGRQLDVVRLAVNGYKQPQQFMTLSYLLALGAEFDLLLNIDGFNEVALHAPHNGTQGVFPAFPREPGVSACKACLSAPSFARSARSPTPRPASPAGRSASPTLRCAIPYWRI